MGIKDELMSRWAQRKGAVFIKTKFVGFELRSADPNAHDMSLARELGFSAVLVAQMKQVNATIVTMKGGELVCIPLSEIIHGTKHVDTKSLSYKVAQTYMIRLQQSDLADVNASKMAETAGMEMDDFIRTYAYIARGPIYWRPL